MKRISRGINLIILIYLAMAVQICQAQSQEPIQNDFGSVTIQISEAAFDLKKNWIVPARHGGITEMGAFISPNAAGYSILASFIFELNGIALDKNYQQNIKNLIETSNKNIPTNVGQLFRFTYNYNDFGTPDVSSIRFTTMGVGESPEQSLAFGPIDQISLQYPTNAVFPIESAHYVWIYKKSNGSLSISTIKEPFLNNLSKKAMEIKTKMLENSLSQPIISDRNIKDFNIAEKWQKQALNHKKDFEKIQRYNDVVALNSALMDKQIEFNALRRTYAEAMHQNNRINSMILFIDVCQSLTSALSKNNTIIQKNEKEIYTFEVNSSKLQLNEIDKKIKNTSNDINLNVQSLERIFKSSNIPPPLP